MEYRALGTTGLEVSCLGFGGAPMGIPDYLSHDDRDSDAFRSTGVAAVREAVARGVNYFDTAPGYGDGRSERIFGEALDGLRDRVVLASKYSFREGLTPEQRTDALRASLDRLRTDRVDVLQFHGGYFDDEFADRILASGVLDWVDEMRAKGLCRFRGITAEGPSGGLERLLRTGRFDVLMIAYNLIYQSTCNYADRPTGIIPFAKSLGIGVTTMRPTTCGFLQKLLGAAFPGLDTAGLTRLAIRFVLSTPEVDCCVVGMRTPAEVVANAALAEDAAGRLDIRWLHNRFA
ncbi:MAG TPA: aldo/keto reductase [Planctomycetota bacterium]|nr:aldo/keto reductase [Planctomycetota bacterium]